MSETAIDRLDVSWDQESGKNILTVVLDDGTKHSWPFASAATDVVAELDLLSADVFVSPAERVELEKNTFAAVLGDIAEIQGPIALDPRTGADEDAEIDGALLAGLVDQITLSVSEYDNGWFPRATLIALQPHYGDQEIELLDRAWDLVIASVDDTSLYPAFQELGGAFRHDPDWELTLRRTPGEENR